MEERTLLAWIRTVIAALALADAFVPRSGHTFDILVGMTALTIALVLACADDYPCGRIAR